MARAFRCRYCGRFFRPDPRKRGRSRQKTCGREGCRQANERRRWREWTARTGGTARQAKVRAWAKIYPDYWRAWRAENAAYREREALRMRRKRARLRRVAKQTLRRDSLVEKLLAVKRLRSRGVAKQTVIARRVEALTDALIWSQTVAKHRVMGRPAGAGG